MTTTSNKAFSIIFKERIHNMPEDIITGKEILAYTKNIIKQINQENKKVKKALNEKPKRKVSKHRKAVEVDEYGNEKPKKLNKYQQYLKDNQKRVKEENPELTNTERFSKLAKEWNEYKKSIDKQDNNEKVNTDNVDKEIIEVKKENDVVEVEKKKRKKSVNKNN